MRSMNDVGLAAYGRDEPIGALGGAPIELEPWPVRQRVGTVFELCDRASACVTDDTDGGSINAGFEGCSCLRAATSDKPATKGHI